MDCAQSGQRQFPLWTHYVMYVSHLLLGKDTGLRMKTSRTVNTLTARGVAIPGGGIHAT